MSDLIQSLQKVLDEETVRNEAGLKADEARPMAA